MAVHCTYKVHPRVASAYIYIYISVRVAIGQLLVTDQPAVSAGPAVEVGTRADSDS